MAKKSSFLHIVSSFRIRCWPEAYPQYTPTEVLSSIYLYLFLCKIVFAVVARNLAFLTGQPRPHSVGVVGNAVSFHVVVFAGGGAVQVQSL